MTSTHAAPAWAAGTTLVDLSLPLAEDLPCHWPTHLPFQHKAWNWFAPERTGWGRVGSSGPYATKWMLLDEHCGTHMDAPSHFVPPPGSGLPDAGPAGAVTAADVPLDRLAGPAAVLDVSGTGQAAPGESPVFGPGVVTAWEAAHGRLAAGDVVLLRSGWSRYYKRGQEGSAYLHDVVVRAVRPGWPAPSAEAVELLAERGIRCVGTDAPSIGAAHDPRPAHVAGLRRRLSFVECLGALEELPPRGAWFCFLPLRVEGGTGAPGRAVAFRPA